MAKPKLKNKEIRRLSFLVSREIEKSKKNLENTRNQIFDSTVKKRFYIEQQEEDISFLKEIKEKLDIETFGRHG